MFCTCWLATCAWRHRSVQLFDVWTSKSGPKPRFFNILTYKLTNVTAAFWHTNFKKVVWEWCVLCILQRRTIFWRRNLQSLPNRLCVGHFELKMRISPQRRENIHFSFDDMAPRPPLQRAYFPTFQTHKSLEKQSISRLFWNVVHPSFLSSDFASLLCFSSDPTSADSTCQVCFSSPHIVGSLTCNLPSVNTNIFFFIETERNTSI